MLATGAGPERHARRQGFQGASRPGVMLGFSPGRPYLIVPINPHAQLTEPTFCRSPCSWQDRIQPGRAWGILHRKGRP